MKWAEIIREANNSGLTKTEWCRQNDIRIRQFYYWQKVVREHLPDECPLSDDLHLHHSSNSSDPNSLQPDFYDITSVSDHTGDSISKSQDTDSSIEIKHGDFSFQINNNSSEEALKKIIRILSNA